MELFSKATFYTYRMTSPFSLVVVGRGDVLAMGNPSKKRDTWKGKCETIKRKCSKFQEDIYVLQEKIICVKAFQEEMKIHGYPSTLAARITKVYSCLEAKKKYCQQKFASIEKANRRANEAGKSL